MAVSGGLDRDFGTGRIDQPHTPAGLDPANLRYPQGEPRSNAAHSFRRLPAPP